MLNPLEVIRALRDLFASVADVLAKELEIKTKELELWVTGAAQGLIDDLHTQLKAAEARVKELEKECDRWEAKVGEKNREIDYLCSHDRHTSFLANLTHERDCLLKLSNEERATITRLREGIRDIELYTRTSQPENMLKLISEKALSLLADAGREE
jgi:hypothetical protein